MMLPGDPPRSA